MSKQNSARQKNQDGTEELSLSSLAQKRQSQPAGKQGKRKYQIGRGENDDLQVATNMATLVNQQSYQHQAYISR